MISIRNVHKSFGGTRPREVLRDISLELQRGDYVAIVGESGAGKSTLLNIAAGLEPPDRGSILLEGIDLTAQDDAGRTMLRRRHVGFVFQAFHLLPHLTAAENVALPLALNGLAPAAARARVAAMLAAVGLADAATAYPRELSGGELQRVSIARALAHRPLLLLADEPTGNLDRHASAQVLGLIRGQVKEQGGAGILVTHSALAASTADRIYVLTPDGLRPQREHDGDT